MRVGLIAEFSNTGGTFTYFTQLVLMLQQQGVEVVALVHCPKDHTAFYEFAQKHALCWEQAPFPLELRNRPFGTLFREIAAFIPFVLRHRPDLIFVSTGTPGCWLTPFLFPLPAVQVLHSLVQPVRKKERRVLSWLLSRISSKHQLVTVSRFAAKNMEQHWNRSVPFIYNSTPFPDALTVPKNGYNKRILTMGWVEDYKNPEVWLNAAQRVIARHPDASFHWYGEGAQLERMRLRVKGLQQIKFCGPTTTPREAYAEAAIYFHPSRRESHGIAVLEAMSFGLPCITSDCGGLPESVQHGVTGYVEGVDDVEAFTERICALLEDDSLKQSMGLAAQKRVAESFMPQHWATQVWELIESVRNRSALKK